MIWAVILYYCYTKQIFLLPVVCMHTVANVVHGKGPCVFPRSPVLTQCSRKPITPLTEGKISQWRCRGCARTPKAKDCSTNTQDELLSLSDSCTHISTHTRDRAGFNIFHLSTSSAEERSPREQPLILAGHQ